MDFGRLLRGERGFTLRDVIVMFFILVVGTGAQFAILLLAFYAPTVEIKIAFLAVYSLIIFGMGKLFLPLLFRW